MIRYSKYSTQKMYFIQNITLYVLFMYEYVFLPVCMSCLYLNNLVGNITITKDRKNNRYTLTHTNVLRKKQEDLIYSVLCRTIYSARYIDYIFLTQHKSLQNTSARRKEEKRLVGNEL